MENEIKLSRAQKFIRFFTSKSLFEKWNKIPNFGYLNVNVAKHQALGT